MTTPKIIYQGDPGSYSYEAMYKYFGEDINYESKDYFSDVFEDISEGKATFGVIPIENSTTGGVYEVFDLLNKFENCYIVGETFVEVTHNLMALKGASIDDIQKVYSHPQALDQCKEYIRRMKFEEIPYRNTASSAKLIGQMKDMRCAAIASKVAAHLYDLKILDTNINNYTNNITKFIIISNTPNHKEDANKISLILVTSHSPGSLYEALGCFANNKVNIMKLESRPIKNIPWQYSFYIDIEGNLQDENVIKSFEQLKFKSNKYKVLGNY